MGCISRQPTNQIQFGSQPWLHSSKSCLRTMLITVGWAALAAVFTFSIAMVVWGRNGDGTINF